MSNDGCFAAYDGRRAAYETDRARRRALSRVSAHRRAIAVIGAAGASSILT